MTTAAPQIVSVRPIIGLEVHIELACRSKAFSRVSSPAAALPGGVPAGGDEGLCANTLIDPVVLGLPGALPRVNAEALRMSVAVGLALGCSVAPRTRFDRKSYFYADMPKGYQISQYDLPVCFDGAVDLPRALTAATAAPTTNQNSTVPTTNQNSTVQVDWDAPTVRIGIIRAHLEEDAGKLMHEAPGGGRLDHSIVDLNRTGTALLEIVTQPDFSSPEQVVIFCQHLRTLCRHMGVTLGVMQKGHIRFEPNINCELTLDNATTVRTPISEVKNLNSFRAVRGAIEHELREQPARWLQDQRVHAAGTKTTRGWDDARQITTLQRSKEDAHDYRYFPEPDLPPVLLSHTFVEQVRATLTEAPDLRQRRWMRDFELSAKEAAALIEEPPVCQLFERAVTAAVALGVPHTKAGRQCANIILQHGFKLANERAAQRAAQAIAQHSAQHSSHAAAEAFVTLFSELGITADALAGLARLRDAGSISAQSVGEMLEAITLLEPQQQDARLIEQLAIQRGLIVVRDAEALDAWCAQAITEQPQAAADVRAGRQQAIGRLVGAAMKASAGRGDAAALREALLRQLSS